MEESELEAFRQQWRQEVSARTQASEREPQNDPEPMSTTGQRKAGGPKSSGRRKSTTKPSGTAIVRDENEEAVDSGAYHDLENLDDQRRLGTGDEKIARPGSSAAGQKSLSALDHFEAALEKESQGSLGESLGHYRKAYRIDPRVDKTYRAKHFPPGAGTAKPVQPNGSKAGQDSISRGPQKNQSTISELIASFSNLTIPKAPPPTDQSPRSPCPIATLPSEVLIDILMWTAIADVAAFSKLGQVCKQFAYLFATEERIWRRICLGSEVGFAAMHYSWTCNIDGSPIIPEEEVWPLADDDDSTPTVRVPSKSEEDSINPLALAKYNSSWLQMFGSRPRIRFNGCYISTNNYVRPGAASTSQVTWNSPVHIVTYYRYFRFFRDGTAISLLTTTEPIDVVHHLTKENLEAHRVSGGEGGGGASSLPSAVMKSARKGRWRLSGTLDGVSSAEEGKEREEPEGELYVETEGADAKYQNIMHLTIKTAGRGTKNNKLNWRNFFTYNRLTEAWGELTLPHDKGYLWSRVKSYGHG